MNENKPVLFGGNKEEIVDLMQKAYADEWLAYYQYWIGAKIVKGPLKDALIKELLEHADDELRHASMIADRLGQLGVVPIINPKDWIALSNCGYEEPSNPFVKNIIEQNIKGEQCAISVYKELIYRSKDVDIITYNLVLKILEEEMEHEIDLQSLAEDLELMIEYVASSRS